MIELTVQHNLECKSPLHSEHLCYIISQGFHLSDKQDYDCLVENPQFRCEHCKRIAKGDQNLCKPHKL